MVISKHSKGFTIIELIVVIAIIAVLAAVVISSTISYIRKSQIAGIKAELSVTFTGATDYLYNNGSSSGFCGNATGNNCTCPNNNTGWGKICNALPSSVRPSACCYDSSNSSGNCSTGQWQVLIGATSFTPTYCIDSSGFKGSYPGSPNVSNCTCLSEGSDPW
jgi:prepilin-type N-terminal cleavage/methylation domain-containing protein